MGIFLGIVIIVVLLTMMLWASGKEHKAWNDGHCQCGGNWNYFDSTSQGCRGYECDECHRSTWQTYGHDQNKGDK